MNIREYTQKHIELYAPKGVKIVLEDKSDFIFYLSWPCEGHNQQVIIVLPYNYEREFESVKDAVKQKVLTDIRLYLEKNISLFGSDFSG
jgi:hypothetical protein